MGTPNDAPLEDKNYGGIFHVVEYVDEKGG